MFNPRRQGERFDPDGEYVRRWVPELADVPAAAIHEPHRHGDGPPATRRQSSTTPQSARRPCAVSPRRPDDQPAPPSGEDPCQSSLWGRFVSDADTNLPQISGGNRSRRDGSGVLGVSDGPPSTHARCRRPNGRSHRARLHELQPHLRGLRWRRSDRRHPPRPRPRRDVARHRRRLRPLDERARRRQGDRRPTRRGGRGHQVRHHVAPPAGSQPPVVDGTPEYVRVVGRRLARAGSASTTSTSTTNTAPTSTCRSRRPSGRWPNSSPRARCATSDCPRRRWTRSAGPPPCTRSPPCRASGHCGAATSRPRSFRRAESWASASCPSARWAAAC